MNHRPIFCCTAILLVSFSTFFGGCSSAPKPRAASQKKTVASNPVKPKKEVVPDKAGSDTERSKGSMISIKEDSPADTVRVFYKRLREKRFRDAIMLTNMRPAIEGLTESEMKDLGVDFGFLAKRVPAEIPINGEIVTGSLATVTVKLPNEETDKPEVQEIKLRKEKENWILLVADAEGEKMIRKEGKNYFFSLRIDVHHKEAKAMLDRIGKAQMIYSMKFGGKFADLDTLIMKGFVPEDAKSSVSTGYKYNVVLAADRSTYTATATPHEYGKTGKLSFALKISKDEQPKLESKDLAGKPLLD